MITVPNISADPNQELTIILPDGVNKATLNLSYHYDLRSWYMGLVYQVTPDLTLTITNRRVYTNPNMLSQWKKILPFGLACVTIDGTDPFFIDDFTSGRCALLLLSATELDNLDAYLTRIKDETQ